MEMCVVSRALIRWCDLHTKCFWTTPASEYICTFRLQSIAHCSDKQFILNAMTGTKLS